MSFPPVSYTPVLPPVRFKAAPSRPTTELIPQPQPQQALGRFDSENRPLLNHWLQTLTREVKEYKIIPESLWKDPEVPFGTMVKRVLANVTQPGNYKSCVMVQVDTHQDGSKSFVITDPGMYTKHVYLADQYRQHIRFDAPKNKPPQAIVFRQAWSGSTYGVKKESIFADKATMKQVATLARQLEDLIEPPTRWQRFTRLFGF